MGPLLLQSQGFHKVSSRRAFTFADLFGFNFFVPKITLMGSWQAGKITLTASKFARCLALNETPEIYY